MVADAESESHPFANVHHVPSAIGFLDGIHASAACSADRGGALCGKSPGKLESERLPPFRARPFALGGPKHHEAERKEANKKRRKKRLSFSPLFFYYVYI